VGKDPQTAEVGSASVKAGLAWMIGFFAICPCHLPVTLAVLGMVLSGTVLGVFLQAHPWVAGSVMTAAWAAGTWRGLQLLRGQQSGAACTLPSKPAAAQGRRRAAR